MSPWLRHDDSRCLNRKIGLLTDGEYRALDGLHEYLARRKSRGSSEVSRGFFEDSELVFAIFLTPFGPKRVTRKQLNSFVKAGLVDTVENGYEVHDWDEYQPKDPTAADRMRRHRERNGTVTDAVTPDVTNRNSRARGPVPSPSLDQELSQSVNVDLDEENGRTDGDLSEIKGEAEQLLARLQTRKEDT